MPIVVVGKAVGLLAVPLAGAFIAGQVKKNDACIQVIVDRDSGKLRVDWSMVYAHASEADLKKSKVYRSVERRFQVDRVAAVPLNMSCNPDGSVRVSERSSAAMHGKVTTYLVRD